MMVTQITKGIKISVETEYQSSFYKQRKLHYSFKYSVKIENHSKEIVKLNSRHWIILDSLNNKENINGEGIIGEKPILKPRSSHTYSSVCHLASTFGSMYGFYRMTNLNSKKTFKVDIPVFRLNAPFSLN